MEKPAIEPIAQSENSGPPVPLTALLMSFLKLGTTSFGGGTLGWTHREVVERRQWIGEEKFLQILTIAQVLPGPNPVNLAVYIGMHLRGFSGAAVAALGMIALPFCIILLLAFIYQHIADSPLARTVLAGLACVGIASMLATGIKSAGQLKRRVLPIAIAAAIFILVGVLRWSMIGVVCAAVPISVLCAYWLRLGDKNG